MFRIGYKRNKNLQNIHKHTYLMMLLQLSLWASAIILSCYKLQVLGLPERIILQNVTRTCGSFNRYFLPSTSTVIRDILNPYLNDRYGPVCNCGGIKWTKIVDLDMSNPTQTCPTNWRLVNTSMVRGCGQGTTGRCFSTFYDSVKGTYSQVCGRITAVQFGHPDAFGAIFDGSNTGLEGHYVDGVSITHGAVGSRNHIWSFAAAVVEQGPVGPITQCECTNRNVEWPFVIPSWIGSNYFCETANSGPVFNPPRYHLGDLLWDGKECGPASTCCQTNNPPYFCASLPGATSDDIEVRLCSNEGPAAEDTVITRMELYVK